MDTIWHAFWVYVLFRKHKAVNLALFGAILPDILNMVILGWNFLMLGFTWMIYANPVMPVWALTVNYLVHSSVVILFIGILLWYIKPSWMPFAYGMGLHAILDYITHHTDAYPSFYPLSSWKFVSPFSYWETSYFSQEILFINLIAAMITIGILLVMIEKASMTERFLALFGIAYCIMLVVFYTINQRSFELIVNGIIPLLFFIVFFVKTLKKWPFFVHT